MTLVDANFLIFDKIFPNNYKKLENRLKNGKFLIYIIREMNIPEESLKRQEKRRTNYEW